MAVQEWNQVDTYNLYQSDLRGVRYSLVLENVRSSRQAEENVVIDILEVGTRQGRNSSSSPPPPVFHLPCLGNTGTCKAPDVSGLRARGEHRELKTEREAGFLVRFIETVFANEEEIPGG